jgi:hypothetical protein
MKEAAADVLFQLGLVQGPIRDGRPVKAAKFRKDFTGDQAMR